MVSLEAGELSGFSRDGVECFLGIPYAAPPVGPLRFRPPLPAAPWDGVLSATSFGPQAPQGVSALFAAFNMPVAEQSEDCLTLNVWAPPSDGSLKPVMVWIHGGAFIQGSAGITLMDGFTFARDGVVFVSCNYRLGALGFLQLDDYPSSGNLGLLDQISALTWVRDNIERFGGDPSNVTLFGESAGAMSVAAHLGSPLSKGLFHKAILQSGAASNFASVPSARDVARKVLAECGDADPMSIPVDAFVAAQKAVGEIAPEGSDLRFCPVVDGVTLDRPPLDAIASGFAKDVPLITGTTQDEWTLAIFGDLRGPVTDRDALIERTHPVFGDRADSVVGVYEAARPTAYPGDVYCAIATDQYVRMPSLKLADAHMRAGGTAFCFEFAWPSPAFGGMLKACHGLDVPFVFDTLGDQLAQMLAGPDAPRELASAMHTAWISFARTGDPGWPAYSLDERQTMVFDTPSAVVPDLRGEERVLWATP
jgi:para-nitrobenzyl esterase